MSLKERSNIDFLRLKYFCSLFFLFEGGCWIMQGEAATMSPLKMSRIVFRALELRDHIHVMCYQR